MSPSLTEFVSRISAHIQFIDQNKRKKELNRDQERTKNFNNIFRKIIVIRNKNAKKKKMNQKWNNKCSGERMIS